MPPQAMPLPHDLQIPIDIAMQQTDDNSQHSSAATLKRRASSTFQDSQDSTSRKRLKEDMDEAEKQCDETQKETIDGQALADDLEQELQCGCCSALVYRPVIVSPCQHFFCGSCVVLWIRNGGSNCPACRGVSTSVSPSRALQSMADLLVRAAPSRARSIAERMQADEVYKAGLSIRIPTPRQASPEPTIPQNNGNYILPCPHCFAGNQWGWRCPQPIPNPETDPDNAWHTDDGTPPGHGYCGNCESVIALQAPTTTKCDFCQVSFCGIGVPGRCVAAPLLAQHPHGLSDLGDLIQCSEIYECFDHNTVEVEIMLDYLTAQSLTPRHIYREIIALILRSERQFAPLFELELFTDIHGVAGGTDPDPTAPRSKICRMCATEILLWGLRLWWVQERKKGFLEEAVMKRPDCPNGGGCSRQKDHSHAKEFNHIISSPDQNPIPEPPPIPQEPNPQLPEEPERIQVDEPMEPVSVQGEVDMMHFQPTQSTEDPQPPQSHLSQQAVNIHAIMANALERAATVPHEGAPALSSVDQVDALL
ncbi:E3 ubiquitin-protein ligase CHFR [Abortiporus biennis]